MHPLLAGGPVKGEIALSRFLESREWHLQDARSVLEYALEIDPDYLPAMNNLGEVYQELAEHDLQMKNCLQVVSKHPDPALSFIILGRCFSAFACSRLTAIVFCIPKGCAGSFSR